MVTMGAGPSPRRLEMADRGGGFKKDPSPRSKHPPGKLGLKTIRRHHKVFIKPSNLQKPSFFYRQISGHRPVNPSLPAGIKAKLFPCDWTNFLLPWLQDLADNRPGLWVFLVSAKMGSCEIRGWDHIII